MRRAFHWALRVLSVSALYQIALVELARAIPQLSYTSVSLEDRVFAGPSGQLSLHIDSGVNDPLGVPGNIVGVRARHTATGRIFDLPYQGAGPIPWESPSTPTFAPYFRDLEYSSVPDGSRTGRYEISVLNAQGESATRVTHFLSSTAPLARASVRITGPSLTPTISWAKIPGANIYEVRISDAETGMHIYDASSTTNPSFTVPSGFLTPSRNYDIHIGSAEKDRAGNLERASRSFRQHTTRPLVLPPTDAPPSDSELTQFAKAAYGRPPATSRRDGAPDAEEAIRASGYSEIAELRRQGVGFETRVYSNNSRTQVVFAIAGTDDAQDIIADASFATGVPNDAMKAQVSNAVDVLVKLKNDLAYSSYATADITVTGHSLGGAVAQMIGHTAGVRTVSFNAPGPGSLINDDELKDRLDLIRSPTPGSDLTNYRVYGDLVSTVGQPLAETQTITKIAPYPHLLIALDPLMTFKPMHFMDTIIGQMEERVTTDVGPTAATVLITGAIIGVVSPHALLVTTLAHLGINYVLDPGGVDGYMFKVEDGSPLIDTITFPFLLGSEALFRLETFLDGTWIHLGVFNELDSYSFGQPGVSDFRFFLLDYVSGLPLPDAEEFSIGITFSSDGFVVGELTSFSTVSEPSSVPVLLTALGIGFLIKTRRRSIMGSIVGSRATLPRHKASSD